MPSTVARNVIESRLGLPRETADVITEHLAAQAVEDLAVPSPGPSTGDIEAAAGAALRAFADEIDPQ